MALTLRGALLGAGNIALHGHAPQWTRDAELRREVEIVAVADLSPANREAARALFPAARICTRAEEILESHALDFCDICTPPFTHRALVEQAASRGVHVLCEKPLAPTVEDTERIARAVRAGRVVFQPCHQYRHSPQWEAVSRLLPRIGRVYLVEYEVQRTQAGEGNPNWSPAWRTDRDFAGGGILVDHGAHIFYQLRAILGEPETVQATVRTLQHRSYRVEDTALVLLDFGGCLAQVSLTWAARRRGIRFRFVGERGEIVGDDQSLRLHGEASEDIRFADGMSRDSNHSQWYAPLFRQFAERVRTREHGLGPLEEALYVTRLIARAYESSREGRALPLVAAARATEALGAPGGMGTSTDLVGLDSSLVPPEVIHVELEVGKSRRTRGLRIGAGAALLAAAAWTFHDVVWGELWSAVRSARLGLIVLAAAINLTAVGFQAARWLAVVRPLSRAATLGQAFKAMLVGFAASTVVPARAGELARMHWFARRTGLPRPTVLASIVLDHLVNAAGLLLGLAILPFFVAVPLWIRPGAAFVLALFTVVAMLVFGLRPISEPPAPPSTERLPAKGLAAFLASARQGLAATTRPRALGLSLSASLMSWALEINVTAVAMRAVGLHLPFTAAFLTLLAVNLALAVPFAPPGNIGTLEVGATLALVGFGVPKEQALAFGLVYHFLQVVPIGILGMIFAGRRRGNDDGAVPA
jgi:predicted dehydrogenase/uncharacterized membrane protein YbhN (UPF0104 family)